MEHQPARSASKGKVVGPFSRCGLVTGGTPMPVLITDPVYEQKIRAELDSSPEKRREEVWEGLLVVPPMANNEHQLIVSELVYVFRSVVDRKAGDRVLPGCNISDRDKEWTQNYRDPDIAVYLSTNPAKDSGTHWVGGPDLLVEIVSPGEDPRQKHDFYAKVKTREVLVVDRDPWAVELYQLKGGKLVLLGKSDAANPAVLTSTVLPLKFELRPGTPRPTILVTHTATGQTWTA
jgi:Uma2 family endonuclease